MNAQPRSLLVATANYEPHLFSADCVMLEPAMADESARRALAGPIMPPPPPTALATCTASLEAASPLTARESAVVASRATLART